MSRLTKEHLAKINGSGLPEHLITLRGYASITDAELPEGFNDKQRKLAKDGALLLPMYGVKSEVVGYQIRPNVPRTINDREMKYESPAGSRPVIDVPPAIPRGKLYASEEPIWFTEGVLKADAAVAQGVVCLALTGVWNWKGRIDNDANNTAALSLFDDLSLKGRTTYVAFDSDAATKYGVHQATTRFGSYLAGKGADVHIIQIPDSGKDDKTGLDDWLVGGGTLEALKEGSVPLAQYMAASLHSLADGPKDKRPKVNISNDALAIGNIRRAIEKGETETEIFDRSGQLTRIVRRKTLVNGTLREQVFVEPYEASSFRAMVEKELLTYRITRKGEPMRALPDITTCNTILGADSWPVRYLSGVVGSPVLRPDKTLLSEAGYDEMTGLYHLPRVPLTKPVSETPTKDECLRAREIILDWMLHDFPWESQEDKANYVALLFTPLLKTYISSPVPVGVFKAANAGSGKTLLVEIFQHLYGTAKLQWGDTEAELRKQITATLANTAEPVVFIDNLPNGYTVRSAVFSDLLTSTEWGDRMLGQSKPIRVPNDRVWLITGNNLKSGDDMARRMVWVRIDPGAPDADQRPQSAFKVGNLIKWLEAGNAERVLRAMLTLVKAWANAGAPRATHADDLSMANFSTWSETAGGLLEFLDIPGFLGNRKEMAEGENEELDEWGPLLEALLKHGKPMKAADMLRDEALKEHIPTIGGELPNAKKFGHWLKARKDRWIGKLRIREAEKFRGTVVWTVERHESDGGKGSAGSECGFEGLVGLLPTPNAETHKAPQEISTSHTVLTKPSQPSNQHEASAPKLTPVPSAPKRAVSGLPPTMDFSTMKTSTDDAPWREIYRNKKTG